MDKIIEYIKDPSWWFSAFIVAIIASLLASYLRTWLNRFLSSISSSLRARIQRSEKIRDDLVNTLSQDDTLLIIHSMKSYLYVGLFFILLIFFSLWSFRIIVESGIAANINTNEKIYMLVISVLVITMEWLALRELKIVQRAKRKRIRKSFTIPNIAASQRIQTAKVNENKSSSETDSID